MGYRLYCYEKGKEEGKFDICLWKFYAYAEYKYVKRSWEYLWPKVIDQVDTDYYFDETYESAYELEHIVHAEYNVDAKTFREFIDLYISDRNLWVKDTANPYFARFIIDLNDPQYKKLKDLYDSDCDKTLEWG